MLLKLTSSEQDKVTIVNLNNVESMYQIYSPQQNCMFTKICFSGNKSFVVVKEDLQTIMELEQNYVSGIFQDVNWVTPPVYKNPNKVEMIGSNLNDSYQRRSFNTQRSYNENLF